ncbi:GPI ethanolamine phosphate transferase 2 [Oxyura jamaicensis]|uniref:GPI ethanolamine phosphate transferase 2 n=1 Tax=Oxyura jamaicensis TaxID=8884 RepID=UPI0015A5F824|nr:GPI ethanolamine phosphate transferase 2 [Oxyura jamaicensis]
MRLRSGVLAAGCLLLQALGVAIFLRGFFPLTVRARPRGDSRGESPAEPAPPGPGAVSNWTKIPPPLFKKVVIVLIDALRDDFVFGSKGKQFMPYTTQVIEKGTSYSFIAEAKPPTVTMPRIKALMTGSIPGFIDVVVNLNSPALLDDNLIWQAKTAGKRIIFYGDDTWVKLFPKHFVEYDGTTSFFVSDFTEVDDNVTRHLDRVLKREDWDLLILHYLGLDHIGHVTGPNSPLVGPKLREMDNILKKIHISLLSKEGEASLPSLLVVCGDHGMSETGSHGGSSEGEVHTPLLFISSAFEKRSGPLTQPELVQQTDLASTLAVGLGLPISRNSVGNLILPVVGGKTMREQLRFLHLNGFQLSSLLKENTPAYEKGKSSKKTIYKRMINVQRRMEGELRRAQTYKGGYHDGFDTYKEMVGNMKVTNPVVSSSSWSEVDVLMLAGTIGHVLSLGASSFIEEEHQTWYFLINTLCLALCQELCRNHFLLKECDPQHGTSLKQNFDGIGEASDCKNIDVPASGNSKLDKVASSAELIKGSDKWISLASPWIILICCRLLRSLNQTGVQWAHRPDFGHWLTSSEHKSELSFLAAVSLVMIFFLVQRRCSLVSKIAMALGLLGVYSYRAAIGNVVFPWQHDSKDISKGITEARFVYVFVLGIVFTGTKDLLKSQVISADSSVKSTGLWEVYSGLVLLAALLFRPHNLPVLVFCLLIQTMMTKYVWRPLKFDAAQITIMHYWFGQAFFYFQGNSNGIATVDVSAGFVGLESYVEIPAIFLTAFATYAGPLLWAIHLLCYLSSEVSRNAAAVGHGCFCYALMRSIPVAIYIVLVTGLRYHLFIWSVFSPKLLYEGVHVFITAAVCLFFTAMDQNHSQKVQD